MSGEVMANSDGAAIDELDIREWFMNAELSEAIATHNIVEGILSMRQQQPAKRKRRVGVKRKKDDQPRLLDTAGHI